MVTASMNIKQQLSRHWSVRFFLKVANIYTWPEEQCLARFIQALAGKAIDAYAINAIRLKMIIHKRVVSCEINLETANQLRYKATM